MRPNTTNQRHFRRGTITVIVVAFLTLLAVVGLTFLIASQNYSTSSRVRRDHENREETPPIPVEIFNSVLGDIIYDAPDDDSGAKKPIRGWGLARNMYGLHPNNAMGNMVPFAGLGRPSGFIPSQLAALATADGVADPDDYKYVNYTYFQNDGFVRDPERFSQMPSPARPTPSTPVVLGDGVNSQNYWPWNPNYTYPDENHLFLAAVDWNTGRVLVPSYYRPRCFGTPTAGDPWALSPPLLPNGTVNPAGNPNWLTRTGKYKILRPRPAEHPNFPYPSINSDGTFGDVENLLGKQTPQKDSFWMDFDLPVRMWRGKLYKPLVALLVVDLDGRVNVNVAGNAKGPIDGLGRGSHAANQGWGPWEVNPFNVLNGNTNDVAQLMYGANNTAGRYGRTAAPVAPPAIAKRYTTHSSGDTADTITNNSPAPGNYLPHFYAPVDYDASYPFGATPSNWRLPNSFEQFAVWGPHNPPPGQNYDPNNRYWNGTDANAPLTYSERGNHASLFNPYLIPVKQSPTVPTTESRVFGVQEMAYLNRRYSEANPNFYQQAALGQLLSSVSSSAKVRSQITTISNDLDRPGAMAGLQIGDPQLLPVGMGQPPTFAFVPNYNQQTPQDASDRRSLAAVLGATDINRPLTDYRTNTSTAYAANNLATGAVLQRAVQDRQRMAADIFVRLRAAIGAREHTAVPAYNPGVANPQYDALRYLAQLAVNIVDYIDNDDYITPFKWTDPNGGVGASDDLRNDGIVGGNYVFGHELPRLVINEVFTYYDNDPNDPKINMPAMGDMPKASTKYIGKVWVELHNPLTPQSATQTGMLSDNGAAILSNNVSGTQYDAYQLLLAKPDANLYSSDNVRGTPHNGYLDSALYTAPNSTNEATSFFPANKAVLPNTLTPSPYGPNASFLVVGPTYDTANPKPGMAGTPCILPDASNYQGAAGLPTVAMTNLSFDITLPAAMATDPPAPADLGTQNLYPTVILRRLVNPHLPPAADNPYITIDTMRTDPSWMYNHVQYNQAGPVAMAPQWSNAYSYGRYQPYQGFIVPTDPPAPAAPGATALRQNPQPDPGNTFVKMAFGRHNGQDTGGNAGTTLKQPFDWPVHLDRAIISTAELLHVSACKPSEFTHYFRKHPTLPLMTHTADWFGLLSTAPNDTGLHRAFDLLRTGSRIHGMGNGGRVPGKINVNTMNFSAAMTDKNVFDSVCHLGAGGAGNSYTAADTLNAWNALNQAKWPTGTPQWTTQTDRPFMGSVSPAGKSLHRSLLLNGKAHTYQATELLQTTMNNFTTRSNTFAVYATVGYFEVEGLNTHNQPQLGRELVSETGAVTRHRFFAIVDRTNLAVDRMNTSRQQTAKPVYFSYEPVAYGGATIPPTTQVNSGAGDPPAGLVQIAIPCTTATVSQASGHYDGVNWTLTYGSRLLIDYQANAGFGEGVVQGATALPTVNVADQRRKAEIVTILNQPGAIQPDLGNGRVLVTVTTSRQHARGATVILLQPHPTTSPANMLYDGFPGNPGPQPSFNFMAENYRAVVPHVEQVE